MTFKAALNDLCAGFYRSGYKAEDGSQQYIATTQMEPIDCRRAFPCFDEPALKATFTATLIADQKMTCLSNMDVKSEKEVESKISGGKRKAVTFNKTPLMSTYLVAFVVGELKVIESNDFRVPVRVYATPDQDIEHGRFSLDLAARTLEFYEKKFDSPYPLPKMDMIAVPDFAAGAMENWGLVTYRVVDLMLDQEKTSASTKHRVAETVQHELAHQWFGNLVTMNFWDGKLAPELAGYHAHANRLRPLAERGIRHVDVVVLVQHILSRMEGLGGLRHRHSRRRSLFGLATQLASYTGSCPACR